MAPIPLAAAVVVVFVPPTSTASIFDVGKGSGTIFQIQPCPTVVHTLDSVLMGWLLGLRIRRHFLLFHTVMSFEEEECCPTQHGPLLGYMTRRIFFGVESGGSLDVVVRVERGLTPQFATLMDDEKDSPYTYVHIYHRQGEPLVFVVEVLWLKC